VLGLIIAHLMIERFPDDGEGALTHRHVALVRKEALAQVAATIGLGRWLQAAASETGQAGGVRQAMLADCCEALIGALYLDGGLEAARTFVTRCWQPLVEAVQSPPRDAKMALQEWAQGRGLERPAYRVVETSGPPHAMTFTVEVNLADQQTASAAGSTKRAAERAAAGLMLRQLEEAGLG
jgi:ribonuclease-3